jgi:hypothetical protein
VLVIIELILGWFKKSREKKYEYFACKSNFKFLQELPHLVLKKNQYPNNTNIYQPIDQKSSHAKFEIKHFKLKIN